MLTSTCGEEYIIDDIEDLISYQQAATNKNAVKIIEPEEKFIKKKHKVIIRPLNKDNNSNNVDLLSNNNVESSIIPGSQTIYIKTWGCTHNSSDSEYMAGQLAAYGYKITDDKLKADLWLLNSCTVKAPAEDHFRNEIEAGKKLNKYIVLAGCVPQGAPKSQFIKGFSIIGVQQIDRVVEVVEETLKGNSVKFLGQKKQHGRKSGGASLILPKIRRNPLIEIIAINTGCLNQCTYCKTKHARGQLGSYSPEEIVERAKQAFYDDNVCELWLTSEDTGAYGRDIGTNLPKLLWKIIEVIPDNCMMRIGMTNPPYILEHLEEICQILNHPKVYSFLHIPVQSGSDQILIDMKREYTRLEFEKVVDFIKAKVPGVTIATDIICGFPTETDQDFDQTMDLCQKYKFPNLFINQFFPRPGTPAAKMIKIPTQQVKLRTKKLSEYFQSYEPYSHKIGQIQTVLVTEISHDKKHYVGHNKFYEQVLLPMKQEYMGKMLTVEIVETFKHSMKGQVIDTSTLKHPNVVEILGVISEPEICLVMEFIQHGSLQSYLAIHRESLTHKRLLSIALDIATGMDYLGSKSIVHRDLAARNILVVNETRVKISDFGLAQVTGNNDYYILQTNRDLPIKWYAPESLRDGKFSARSDVWSFGVTMYETFGLGEDPKLPNVGWKKNGEGNEEGSTELLDALEQGTRLPCPPNCPQNVYVKLMYPCWHLQSHERPDFATLCDDIRNLISNY